MPPPSAQPFTAAIMGLRNFSIAFQAVSRFFSAHIGISLVGISLMSAPTENARSLPVSTMARTALVGFGVAQRCCDLHQKVLGQRIQDLGPVEGDQHDPGPGPSDDDVSHKTALRAASGEDRITGRSARTSIDVRLPSRARRTRGQLRRAHRETRLGRCARSESSDRNREASTATAT